MSDWSAWGWLGFAVVAVLVLAGLVFVLWAILSGAHEAATKAKAEATCPRCGHPIGKPWPEPGTVPDDASGVTGHG